MSLNEMQIFLNKLGIEFTVLVYSTQKQIVLRIPYKIPAENPDSKDIIYDMNGNYLRNI